MCKSIAVSGRIKEDPITTLNGKFSFFWKKFVLKEADTFMCKSIRPNYGRNPPLFVDFALK